MTDIHSNPSFSRDIRLYSHSGLCNRLRLIAEYKHLSDIENKTIQMFWVKSKQCNSLFKDLFKPIPNIKFTYLDKANRPKNTAQKLELFPHPLLIKQKNHLIFEPVDSIMNSINTIKDRIGEEYVACHVRRTDIITIQNKLNAIPPEDSLFDDFIEKCPSYNIFLATDNQDTQQRFIKRFGRRLHVATAISGNGSVRWPTRTTSIEEAVVDLFVCVGAKDFLGTECSSFSTFIDNCKAAKNGQS